MPARRSDRSLSAALLALLFCLCRLAADERPIGFQVLGTKVPDYAVPIPIPAGWEER